MLAASIALLCSCAAHTAHAARITPPLDLHSVPEYSASSRSAHTHDKHHSVHSGDTGLRLSDAGASHVRAMHADHASLSTAAAAAQSAVSAISVHTSTIAEVSEDLEVSEAMMGAVGRRLLHGDHRQGWLPRCNKCKVSRIKPGKERPTGHCQMLGRMFTCRHVRNWTPEEKADLMARRPTAETFNPDTDEVYFAGDAFVFVNSTTNVLTDEEHTSATYNSTDTGEPLEFPVRAFDEFSGQSCREDTYLLPAVTQNDNYTAALLEIGKNICNTVKDTNATDERLQGSIATVAAAQAAALTDILSECGDKGMAEVPTDWLDGLDRRAVEVGALVLQQFEGPIQEEVCEECGDKLDEFGLGMLDVTSMAVIQVDEQVQAAVGGKPVMVSELDSALRTTIFRFVTNMAAELKLSSFQDCSTDKS